VKTKSAPKARKLILSHLKKAEKKGTEEEVYKFLALPGA